MISSADTVRRAPRNALYRLAAAGGTCLGVFFLLGAYGHTVATWPLVTAGDAIDMGRRLVLVAPALVLIAAGLVNIVTSPVLWLGVRWSLTLSLCVNGFATGYLVYLLLSTIADHPIGWFLVLALSQLTILLAIRVGLVWPVAGASRAT